MSVPATVQIPTRECTVLRILDFEEGGGHTNHHVRLSRTRTENDTKPVLVIARRGHVHHLHCTTGESERHWPGVAKFSFIQPSSLGRCEEKLARGSPEKREVSSTGYIGPAESTGIPDEPS